METRTWTAVHASVSIENMPFHGDGTSAWRCFKIYQADARGHIHVLVGKESLMSQLSCHEHVLRHLSTKQCVDKMVCVCVCVCVCAGYCRRVCVCVCVFCVQHAAAPCRHLVPAPTLHPCRLTFWLHPTELLPWAARHGQDNNVENECAKRACRAAFVSAHAVFRGPVSTDRRL